MYMMTTIWVRPGILPGLRNLAEDSSPEVTSSSASVPSLISPAHSLGSSDIGEVDIDLFDLDLNSYPTRLVMAPLKMSSGHGPYSDTSSISGRYPPPPPPNTPTSFIPRVTVTMIVVCLHLLTFALVTRMSSLLEIFSIARKLINSVSMINLITCDFALPSLDKQAI